MRKEGGSLGSSARGLSAASTTTTRSRSRPQPYARSQARAQPQPRTGPPSRPCKDLNPPSSPSTPLPQHRPHRPRSTIPNPPATNPDIDMDTMLDLDVEEREEHFLFTETIWNLCIHEADNVRARKALAKAVSKVAKRRWMVDAERLMWYRSACLWLLEAE
jgi:hypothetical protein